MRTRPESEGRVGTGREPGLEPHDSWAGVSGARPGSIGDVLAGAEMILGLAGKVRRSIEER